MRLTVADMGAAKSNKSKIDGELIDWDEFKKRVSSLSQSKKYLFRGQTEPWRLCTSFHRRGRYRVDSFSTRDIKKLHQRLSVITSNYFDLNVPDQNGAFVNLL